MYYRDTRDKTLWFIERWILGKVKLWPNDYNLPCRYELREDFEKYYERY